MVKLPGSVNSHVELKGILFPVLALVPEMELIDVQFTHNTMISPNLSSGNRLSRNMPTEHQSTGEPV